MSVPTTVHPFVGRHAEHNYLVGLALGENTHPYQMDEGVKHGPHYPRIALTKRVEPGERVGPHWYTADSVEEAEATVQHVQTHDAQHPQECHEVTMILRANTVTNPGAVVIEAGHTFIADGAVFRSHWAPHETG